MPTLYFSYSLPGGDLDIEEPLNSPYTISHHIGRHLRALAHDHGYAFRFVSLDDTTPQTFEPSDIAIGHLWDTPDSFMQQALNTPHISKIILQPYSHGMVSAGDVARYVDMFLKADALLFITGEHWYQTMTDSPFAALYPKVTRLDMGVSCDKHPYLKTRWNKKGERAICVIGNDTPTKGFRHVADLARTAGVRLGHFGSAQPDTFAHVPCMTLHGGMLFTPDNIIKLCDNYDALIALPDFDACPTVLLEAASWGLSIYTSNEAGYINGSPFNELRKNDMAFNVRQMRAFQEMDEYDLVRHSYTLRYVMERDYTFAKMCRQVEQVVKGYL